MKTQLLEDIGENASLGPAPVPAALADIPVAGEAVHAPAPAPAPAPAAAAEPEQASLAPELHSVFEEIAALEAQLVPAVQQHEADLTPAEPVSAASASLVEPRRSLGVGPASRLLQPAGRAAQPATQPPLPQAEPLAKPEYLADDLAFIPDWDQHPAPQDPLFDFTVPAQGSAPAAPFTRPPAAFTQSSRRTLLWGGCVLTAALLAMGGRWFYQERADTAALASVANEAPRTTMAAKREAMTANASAQGSRAEVQMAAAAPADRPVSTLPPLVMLEPEAPGVATPGVATPGVATPGVATPAATVPEAPRPPPPPEEARIAPLTPPKPDPVALRKPAAPAPKPATRKPRERTVVVAAPVKEKRERESVRQPVRASAILAESPARQDTSMTATLKACREYGYGATQCVKRGCSLTRYGFACRGR